MQGEGKREGEGVRKKEDEKWNLLSRSTGHCFFSEEVDPRITEDSKAYVTEGPL